MHMGSSPGLPFYKKEELVIYIEKNTANNIVLELSHLVAPGVGNWMFGFTYESTDTVVTRYLSLTDISPSPDRYNRYILNETALGAQVSPVFVTLPPTNYFLSPGQYRYDVWSLAVPFTLLNYLAIVATPPVSTGHMVVSGDSVGIPTVYDSSMIIPNTPSVYD